MPIRRATAAELTLLPGIETDADQRFAAAGYDFCLDLPCLEAGHLERAQAQDLVRVAEVDGALVGFACGWRVDGAAHLAELAVRCDHARQGVGGGLLAAFEAAARSGGFSRVTLTTYADIPWNAPWYARRGYRPIATDDAPELAALVATEARLGIALAPRVLMAKDLSG